MGFRLDAIKHMDRTFLLTFVSVAVPSFGTAINDACGKYSSRLHDSSLIERICLP